jgi:hypothetical protein
LILYNTYEIFSRFSQHRAAFVQFEVVPARRSLGSRNPIEAYHRQGHTGEFPRDAIALWAELTVRRTGLRGEYLASSPMRHVVYDMVKAPAVAVGAGNYIKVGLGALVVARRVLRYQSASGRPLHSRELSLDTLGFRSLEVCPSP